MRLNSSCSNSLASSHRCLALSETHLAPVAPVVVASIPAAAPMVFSSIVDISAPPFRRSHPRAHGVDNACFQINLCETTERLVQERRQIHAHYFGRFKSDCGFYRSSPMAFPIQKWPSSPSFITHTTYHHHF